MKQKETESETEAARGAFAPRRALFLSTNLLLCKIFAGDLIHKRAVAKGD